MEEEAPCRRSVAELAGRFKGPTPQQDATGQESQEKPVRRRPPRSLQLPKTQEDNQEPPSVTSPLPTKAKRNSALIEKIQANLALSPGALMPSPKSPGFRMLPPAFPPPSPGSALVTGVTSPSTPTPTSPVLASPLTEEEGPASFEDPPVVLEGSTLSNANIKARARHSIRRRPPSRRHRQASSGEDVSDVSEGGVCVHSEKEKEGGGEEQQDGKPGEEEDKSEGSTGHAENETHQEETAERPAREEDEEMKNGTPEREEDDKSSETKVEEEKEDTERRDHGTEKPTHSNTDEEDKMKPEPQEPTSRPSVR
ncbi:unnamed protein product [Tetraodon nigroviridis]|uniref:(spotted green pufferfish) hypothetical protein n=1 Tax=Tetraodon nigroviridis TaxID=99883 RepID=Q4SVF0_TETNG|nr:unnamed protein product [Tetraodon nigroviridis]